MHSPVKKQTNKIKTIMPCQNPLEILFQCMFSSKVWGNTMLFLFPKGVLLDVCLTWVKTVSRETNVLLPSSWSTLCIACLCRQPEMSLSLSRVMESPNDWGWQGHLKVIHSKSLLKPWIASCRALCYPSKKYSLEYKLFGSGFFFSCSFYQNEYF